MCHSINSREYLVNRARIAYLGNETSFPRFIPAKLPVVFKRRASNRIFKSKDSAYSVQLKLPAQAVKPEKK